MPFRRFIKEKNFESDGFYSSLIELYFKLFGRENVLVVFYEELLNDAKDFLAKISDFLGISAFDYSQINRKTKISLTNRGAKIIQKINRLKCPLLAKPFFYLDRRLFRRLNDSELLSPKDKEYLINLYREDNKKLANK